MYYPSFPGVGAADPGVIGQVAPFMILITLVVVIAAIPGAREWFVGLGRQVGLISPDPAAELGTDGENEHADDLAAITVPEWMDMSMYDEPDVPDDR